MTTTCLPVSDPALRQWPEFIGLWPRLKGSQRPRFESRHPGDESWGDRAARLGSRIGVRCMPWQWLTLRAVLSLQEPNEWGDRVWTHRDVCIECPRQNGKTLIVVLRIIFGMLVLGEKIAYTAQEWETAKDVFGRCVDVIERIPSLKKRLRSEPTSAGNRGLIKLGNGEAKFGPRTAKFGRGLTEVDLLILDEAYDLTAQAEASLTGATRASTKATGPQIWYVSTPPVASVHPNCQILTGMHNLGHKRSPDLYYALYAVPEGTELGNVDAYRLAHPSLGVVGDEHELEAKRRKARTAEQRAIFTADYLGIGDYPPDEDEVGSPIPNWSDMANAEAKLTGARTIAVRRSWNRQVWSISAAQMAQDGNIHVEVAPLRTGTHSQIAEYLVAKVTAWNPVALVIDRKNTAQVLEPLLIAAGIEPLMIGTSEIAQSCSGFLADADAVRLSHSDQTVLNDEVATASMRELPGGDFVWTEEPNGAGMPLMNVSMAHWALRKYGTKAPAKTVAARTGAAREHQSHRHSADFDAMSAAF
ncbi:terminase [Mycobacteroides abscessus]